jgi:putative tryptophan/tyrosine transport system substrate-binding protein
MADRRLFIGGIAGIALGAHGVIHAQQGAKPPPQVGVLANTESPSWDAFRRGLREQGYIDGRNVTLVWRWADGRVDRYPVLAAELVQMKVDLIVTSSTPATLAARQATRTTPILMLNSAYPDKVGLVDSLARPGGNITGYSNVSAELLRKKMQLIKEMVPKALRVAVFWDSTHPLAALISQDLQEAAAVLGVEIILIPLRVPQDHATAFPAVLASRADVLHVFVNPVHAKIHTQIVDFALKNKLPSSFEERSFVEAGGLFSYGSSFVTTYQRAAEYVDKILKGAKPAELPIQQPTQLELLINMKTAKAIGLAIPQALLLRADEVFQ